MLHEVGLAIALHFLSHQLRQIPDSQGIRIRFCLTSQPNCRMLFKQITFMPSSLLHLSRVSLIIRLPHHITYNLHHHPLPRSSHHLLTRFPPLHHSPCQNRQQTGTIKQRAEFDSASEQWEPTHPPSILYTIDAQTSKFIGRLQLLSCFYHHFVYNATRLIFRTTLASMLGS